MMLTVIGEGLKLAGETLKAAADVMVKATETVALTGTGEGALAISEAAEATALTGISETLAQAPAVPRLYGAAMRAKLLHDTGTIFEVGDFVEAMDGLDALESMDGVASLPEDQMEQRVAEEFSKACKLPREGSSPAGLYSSPSRLRANGLREWGQACAEDDILDGLKPDLAGDGNPRPRRKLFRALRCVEGQLESVQNAQSRH